MFSYPDASRLLETEIFFPNPDLTFSGGSIDTRTLVPGDLFIALKGSRQDGHAYLEEAFRKKASGALISRLVFECQRGRFEKGRGLFRNLLPVPDPEKALQALASWNRYQQRIPCVGITGSIGKTSTKEFLHFLMSRKFRVLSNQGNFNNHLGLPLTLLRLSSEDEMCIAELGANHAGEIRGLARILQPTMGVITQVAPVHLEGFGSFEAIYAAKLELFEELPAGSPAVIPDNNPMLIQRSRDLKLDLRLVGFSPQADYFLSDVAVSGHWVHFKFNRKWSFAFPGIAPFLAINAGMALACACEMGLDLDEIPEVWNDFRPLHGRFELRDLGNGIQVIYDGYNASPHAFDKALEVFESFPVSGKKFVVFSDMLELGSEEKKFHQDLGRKLALGHFDVVLAYGKQSLAAIEVLVSEDRHCTAIHFETSRDVASCLQAMLRPGDCVLLKASRGMKIEEVLNHLSDRFSKAVDAGMA
ncbi:MAG: UDP-N-acetylmuramoyl-tripeptide--D-alanyl-D-alanine ligase [Candidatus Omnitrophica bacterium]|nr:UDP-N-acetylmuramoyl-tripeptide--D-alanyl-D-alanine ligase [Candidatus Omnitrophota bacterium]